MKKSVVAAASLTVLCLSMGAYQTCLAASKPGLDSDRDGIPDAAERVLGTNPFSADTDGDGIPDKTDKDPSYTPSLIVESSSAPLAAKVLDSRIEDNVNAADHLEIKVKNTGTKALRDFDIYYTVTGPAGTAKEGYYAKLTGFSIDAGATKVLHFDNKSLPAHYSGNIYGMYGTTKKALEFKVSLHSKGFAPLEFSLKRVDGAGDVVD